MTAMQPAPTRDRGVVPRTDTAASEPGALTDETVPQMRADTVIGQPLVEGARIVAEVVDLPTKKTMIQKFRRRKNYRRLKGHTQPYVRVRIKHILRAGEQPPAESPKPAEQPAAPAPAS